MVALIDTPRYRFGCAAAGGVLVVVGILLLSSDSPPVGGVGVLILGVAIVLWSLLHRTRGLPIPAGFNELWSDDAVFNDAVRGLHKGDFSRLGPLFEPSERDHRRAQIVEWHEQGRFRGEPKILGEALTCACFAGRTEVAEYLLGCGVEPSGGAGTGLDAFHWAVNRGQLDAVRLLLRAKAPLGTKSRYGGNVLDTAVWSAINEPRPGQREIIEELLKAGARLENEEWPTGHAEIDELLRQYGEQPER